MMSRPYAWLDIECFSNWFLVGITDAEGNHWDYQQIDGYPLDVAALEVLLRHFTIVTFNGNWYDLQMLCAAVTGRFSCADLKTINDAIIVQKMPPWTVEKHFGFRKPDYIDHIDIMEVAPGVRLGLKQYAGRVHAPEMIETPVDFAQPMPMDHVPGEITYCRNDRNVTKQISDGVADRLALRIALTEKYGVDVRSKSDAQIAEAVIKAEVFRTINESEARYVDEWVEGDAAFPHKQMDYIRDGWGNLKITIPHYNHGYKFKARIPDYIEFVTPQMQDFLRLVRSVDFMVSDKEEAVILGLDGAEDFKTGVQIPPELKGRNIPIGNSVYRVGIGGLHSQESSVQHIVVPGVCSLYTADVDSYYPSLILNAGMSPKQLGRTFLEIYRGMLDQRLAAKSKLKVLTKSDAEYAETKTMEGGFKIVLNGTFGKLFSRYSIFYAPEFGIAVTIGGQLSLLMLIERLEVSGIEVISANTDGIEMKVPFGKQWLADSIIEWWKARTGLGMSGGNYWALYARDVNNYIRIELDGSTKRKGVFRESGLLENKHPDCDICADAVVAFLTRGVPPASTILACTDIRKFVRIRGVTGGGIYVPQHARVLTATNEDGKEVRVGVEGGQYLGKAVRWFYSRTPGSIVDGTRFNQVAGSENAMPCMTLPPTLPSDIDYQWYVDTAEEMLETLGYGLRI